MQRKKQGFTLIELMITIAILAIIATLAAPSMGNLLEKQRFKKKKEICCQFLHKQKAKQS